MDDLVGVFVRDAFSRFTAERDYYHFARGLTFWWSINVVIRNRHIRPVRRSLTYYHGTRDAASICYRYVGTAWSLFLSLSFSIYVFIYLSHTINNSARGRFLWLRNEERAARARAFVSPPDPPPATPLPMCCTTPNGIAPSCRGRIARYNGPLHNGIRTCNVPNRGVVYRDGCCARCGGGGLQLRIFGGSHRAGFLTWHDPLVH